MTTAFSLAGMTEIAATGDQGAIVPMLTTYLGQPERGPDTYNVSVETPTASVGVAMTRGEAGRLHAALGELLDGGDCVGVLG